MIRSLTYLAVLFTVPALAWAADKERAVYPMDINATDLVWQTVNDNVMGGRSRGGFARAGDALVFAGSTNTDGGGFSSIRASLPTTLDLRAATGVELRVRGDGRTYTFMLRSKARYRRSLLWYRTSFATKPGEWLDIRIPLADLEPRWRGMRLRGPALDTGALTGMGLMIYDKQDGAFRLEVERIRAYPARTAFSMARYKTEQRPLLVFAPNANVLQLKRQLDDLALARVGLDERDVALIVVLEQGVSRAGETLLSRDEAAQLRARYGVGAGEFAVRLVGKDGGTKYEGAKPAAAARLFRLIDAMPMRRAEISQRAK